VPKDATCKDVPCWEMLGPPTVPWPKVSRKALEADMN
jgi:hypothetical protein